MNTETLDLIQGVVEEIIAAIPQIVVVLTTVVYSLKAIKERVNAFPKIADETKQQVNVQLKETKLNLSDLIGKNNVEIQEKVGNTLKVMEKELHDYKEELKVNIEQTNLFLRQNKVLVDVLLDIVAKDPDKVSSGIAEKVSAKLNLAKEQLENYPETLVKDIKVLENAMKETHTLIGNNEFEKLLKKIGYGKDN
jgi:uncharacterized protein YoxC